MKVTHIKNKDGIGQLMENKQEKIVNNDSGVPIKKYQVWQREYGSTWFFNDFDTIQEAVSHQTYGDHFFTKLVKLKIEEESK
jgi:hypothetical protein